MAEQAEVSNFPQNEIDIPTGPRLTKEQGVFSAGETRKSSIPGTEIGRSMVNRFERGQILKVYKNIRAEIQYLGKMAKARMSVGRFDEAMEAFEKQKEVKSALKVFRQKARAVEGHLDNLNEQYHHNYTNVTVENERLGRHEIPVLTLDLNPPKEGEEDKRIPYFIVPQYVTNPHQSVALSLALALDGHRVHVMTYPEQSKMAKAPKDWLERVKANGTLSLHSELAKEVSKGMNLKSPNLVGYSMGAAIALEMARDPEFAVEDLIVMDPPTIEGKSVPAQLFDFLVREGVAIFNAEDRQKVVLSGIDRNDVTANLKGTNSVMMKLLSKQQFTTEDLQAVNPHGRYQVWIGGDSKIAGKKTETAFTEAEKGRRGKNPNASPLELYKIEGVGHSLITHSVGITAVMVSDERPSETVTVLKGEDLDNSAAASIVNH